MNMAKEFLVNATISSKECAETEDLFAQVLPRSTGMEYSTWPIQLG
jgi:hypothetical protein